MSTNDTFDLDKIVEFLSVHNFIDIITFHPKLKDECFNLYVNIQNLLNFDIVVGSLVLLSFDRAVSYFALAFEKIRSSFCSDSCPIRIRLLLSEWINCPLISNQLVGDGSFVSFEGIISGINVGDISSIRKRIACNFPSNQTLLLTRFDKTMVPLVLLFDEHSPFINQFIVGDVVMGCGHILKKVEYSSTFAIKKMEVIIIVNNIEFTKLVNPNRNLIYWCDVLKRFSRSSINFSSIDFTEWDLTLKIVDSISLPIVPTALYQKLKLLLLLSLVSVPVLQQRGSPRVSESISLVIRTDDHLARELVYFIHELDSFSTHYHLSSRILFGANQSLTLCDFIEGFSSKQLIDMQNLFEGYSIATVSGESPRYLTLWMLQSHSIKNTRLFDFCDIPVSINQYQDTENDQIIANHMLCISEKQDDLIEELSSKNVKNYLQTARSLVIELSNAARDLLVTFFTTARASSDDIRIGNMHTLTRLAMAHCRLQLRTQVNELDVLVAIMLSEEAMLESGRNSLFFFSLQPCNSFNISKSFAGTAAEQMKGFASQVYSICNKVF